MPHIDHFYVYMYVDWFPAQRANNAESMFKS